MLRCQAYPTFSVLQIDRSVFYAQKFSNFKQIPKPKILFNKVSKCPNISVVNRVTNAVSESAYSTRSRGSLPKVFL